MIITISIYSLPEAFIDAYSDNQPTITVYCDGCDWEGVDLYGETVPFSLLMSAYTDHKEYQITKGIS